MVGTSLIPFKLLGIGLLLVCVSALLVGGAALKDAGALPFGPRVLILLALTIGLPLLSLASLWRAKGGRFVLSVLLHLAVLALLISLTYTLPVMKTPAGKTTLVVLTLLGTGLLFLAILALRHDTTIANSAAAQEVSTEQTRLFLMISAGCMLLLVAIAVWQVVPLLVGRPTIAVDYLAQANAADKPVNCDPNRNAAPYCEKLLAEFVPPPEPIKHRFQSWPADLSPEEFKALEAWAPGHEPALSLLAQAAGCPYCRQELKSTDGAMWNIQVPDLDRLRACAWGVLLLAKYKAIQGDAASGLQLLTDLHMFGVHLAKSRTLVEQMVGAAVCRLSYEAVLALLSHGPMGAHVLKSALHVLAPEIALIVVPRFSEAEHLYGHDCIQRLFTDDGKGNGRLIPRELYRSKKCQSGPYSGPISYIDAVRICLTHPDRRSTLLSFGTSFTLIRELANQTPWTLHVQNTSYEEQLHTLYVGNYYLCDNLGATAQCIRIGWQTRVSGDATVTLLALFAYKAQEGRFPESLRRLVQAGLLLSVPIDPYSGAPLIYKVQGDSFTLYSVGEDFADDGGRPCEWNEKSGDHVFWPVPAPTR